MSWLHKILDHDLHKTKVGMNSRVLLIETPGKKEFLPCVVSTADKGRFLINNSITKEGRIRSGVFEGAEESLDVIIPPLFTKAYELSIQKEYSNIFSDSQSCLSYIKDKSGFKKVPGMCFIPFSWSDVNLKRVFPGLSLEDGMINGYCKFLKIEMEFAVFLSRPDFVGLYTRLPNNQNSVILHNVEFGLAFLTLNV